jgi:serine/threonine protein kinase
VFDNKTFYCFSVVYPMKTRYYYVDNVPDYRSWVSAIKKATGYADLNDIYEVREKLGNGKFGLVKLGIHKTTGRKVAIKIMTKKDMDNKDLELVKTEIDILKICQHPNIIKLYDVFENVDYIYISKI